MADRRTRDRVREAVNGEWDHDDHRTLRLVVTMLGDEIDGLHDHAREIARIAQECSAEDRRAIDQLRRETEQQLNAIRRLIIGGLGTVSVLLAGVVTTLLAR